MGGRTLVLLAAAAVALPMAAADPVSGAWSFETRITEKSCTITGNMAIGLEDESGTRSCQFTSTETCDWAGEGDQGVTVDQSCRVLEQGDFYLIYSRVDQSLTPGYDGSTYMPDNFAVRPTGPDKMVGQWYDRAYRDKVVFWRNREAPIS